MKVQELIDLLNEARFEHGIYSVYDAKEFIPKEVEQVESGLNPDEHRHYKLLVKTRTGYKEYTRRNS